MCPVKLRVKIISTRSGKSVDAVAIANTGFITDYPEIAVPLNTARALDFDYLPENGLKAELETGGGVVTVVTVPRIVKVKVITHDRESPEVIANLMINPYIEDITLSDSLLEELGVQILFPKRGFWKFVNEDKVHESVA